jgi:DHA2 family methylenomycin A resistance protein-like MFS transporter
MAPLLRDQLSSAEDRAATLIRNLPSLSRNHKNPMARKILREGFEHPRVRLDDMDRDLRTLPEPAVTGAPREDRGRAAAALVSVCLGFFVVTIALLRRYTTESPANPDRRADIPGLLLGVTMLAALTASFITAGEQGWLAPLPGALLAAGLITGWLFIRAERRHPHPVLPLTLFRSRQLSGATAVGLIFNLVLYGTLLCLSLYLQQARHEPVLATGLLLLPSSVFTGLGSLASGRLTARLGPRPPMIAGLTLAAAGTALLATAGTSTPLALILAGSVLIGLISLAMPAMTAAVVGAAGREHAGVASGVLNAARQSGGALGVAVLGSLLGRGHALSLHVPLLVATAGYLIAIGLAWTTLRDR